MTNSLTTEPDPGKRYSLEEAEPFMAQGFTFISMCMVGIAEPYFIYARKPEMFNGTIYSLNINGKDVPVYEPTYDEGSQP